MNMKPMDNWVYFRTMEIYHLLDSLIKRICWWSMVGLRH